MRHIKNEMRKRQQGVQEDLIKERGGYYLDKPFEKIKPRQLPKDNSLWKNNDPWEQKKKLKRYGAK